MFLKLVQLLAIFAVQANCALLFWSKRELKIPALKHFHDGDLHKLVKQLGNPTTIIYKSSSADLLPGFRELLDGYHRAYHPNGHINTENSTDILNQDDLDMLKVRQQLESSKENILSIIVIPENRRDKRDVESTTPSVSSTPLAEKREEPYKIPKGPVVYRGKSVKYDSFGILYSSQPLELNTSDDSPNINLGETSPDMISVDTTSKDQFTRLNVNIPLEDGNKVTLRFIFVWVQRYWSLTSVKISDTQKVYQYDLNIESDVTAPANFSYHCGGRTTFSGANGTKLVLYDMQVQIDAPNGRFQDAYDCVNFTSGPIWSGLFVTALLGVGLIVALVAISDIKTMDKFDTQKTKQLSITVAE